MPLRFACVGIGAAVLLSACADGEAADLQHADTQSHELYAYSFAAARRHDEPAECGARPLAMQVVFERSTRKVSAVIASQAWRCSDLDVKGAAYFFDCDLPELEDTAGNTGLGADLTVVLFEPAPSDRITGEAVLTLSSPTGTCEHSYELDGELQR